ncbi:hypothetical protein OTB20_37365 [Streptomyces sp. H27-H1]|uniref:hypothetical protein n=1 Tax=Streptomyces sp. H27-H1 TaxID=2996461 RepID=UPI0022703067|nr:hypothetical protein [Streptomyces sp. H27-H1]MCY0931756.1 hypothetical protein [Streptomyces sp. H27-H1]
MDRLGSPLFTAKRGSVTTPGAADGNGHFEAEFPVTHTDFIKAPDSNQVEFSLTTERNGRSDSEGVTVPVAPVEALVDLDSPTVTGAYGTRATLSGTATWKSADGQWKPVPTRMPIGAAGWTNGLTDAAGRFTLSTQLRGDGVPTVKPLSVWFGSKTTVKVDTTAGAFFHTFAASVGADKSVEVSGNFWRGEIPAGTTSLKVDIQTSADGKTGWTTRKSFDVPTTPGANTIAPIKQSTPYPGPGYVRLRYAGTPAIHGAVTPAVKIARTMTALPRFDAAPEPVTKGKPITVTGTLDHADPTWKPFAGQSVHYYFRPAGTTAWKVMGYSKTAADGTFTKSFTATQSGDWSARYELADATHFIAASRVDGVVVTP